MSESKKLLEKEFENISNLQNINSQNINQLGVLEFQIQKLNQEIYWLLMKLIIATCNLVNLWKCLFQKNFVIKF